ncbi:MAG: Uma2 family endonuclease [Gomphosphaeria aponina SAG 52.96 = DSM 107014]|uniref:Uma2 family endonuclease n=1 Tax=Gomphosphaeria aponina SAG 52.96 = DSM 107014 TaxID=1521640 RepID=A0A941GVW9_9CHRO|nr:Uma2 family endonuclease [Gomphosphaeria aponina SAG 52.96 = DSM 107014]
MVTTQRTISLSLEEFLKLPETKPASEYINGEIIQKPMPQGKHSRLQSKLVTNINQVIETNKTGLAFPELRCTFGGRSIVPDVTVFSWERIPVDEGGDIANVFKTHPDWTIEILSPGQNQTKVTANILHCLQYGSKLGWLIDPEVKMILVFYPNQQTELFDLPEDVLPVPEIFAELSLTLGDVFGWLKL